MTDPEQVAQLVAEFGKAYARRVGAEMERAGTTPARARVLMALRCRGSCTMGEVGGLLAVTPRNVTKLVDGLEEEGLVIREPHPNDRRATLVRLTDRGARVCGGSAATGAGLYEYLSPEDRGQLARILGLLLEVLEGGEASGGAGRA